MNWLTECIPCFLTSKNCFGKQECIAGMWSLDTDSVSSGCNKDDATAGPALLTYSLFTFGSPEEHKHVWSDFFITFQMFQHKGTDSFGSAHCSGLLCVLRTRAVKKWHLKDWQTISIELSIVFHASMESHAVAWIPRYLFFRSWFSNL